MIRAMIPLLGVALSAVAQQMGPYAATYSSVNAGSVYAYGSYTTDASYMSGLHQAYVKVTLRTPSGRTATNTAGWGVSNATASVQLDSNREDGTFTTTGEHKEYCNILRITWTLAATQAQEVELPWVQLLDSSQQKNSLRYNGDSSTHTITVGTSNSCSGSVRIIDIVSPSDPAMQVKVNCPTAGCGGDGADRYPSTTGTQTIGGGGTTYYNFTVKTETTNTKTGKVKATAGIDAKPANCNVLPPQTRDNTWNVTL